MKINKLLTPYNLEKKSNRNIRYIVVHYVGALGGAEANCKYYASKFVGASAHYYVGHNGEVWQSVEDKDVAWHCGAKSYVHPNCRNSNSIGIEMCVRKSSTKTMYASDKDWYFEPATVASTIDLVKELMNKYDIPAEHVIRHYDVTGKTCPAPYVHNKKDWEAFKSALTVGAPVKENTINNTLPTCPFKVKVIIDDLNYREAPSMQGAVKGQAGKGVFTIVEVKDRWGRLKSNVGWIYLENPNYCTILKQAAAAPVKKSIDVIAKEVIAGKWGNGADRKKKLEAAGYNYKEVQARVNALLK